MESEFINDWIDGTLTEDELVNKYECPYTNITTRAKALGIRRNKLIDKINIKEFLEDYRNDMKISNISDKYNMCASSVKGILRPLGLRRFVEKVNRKYKLDESYFDYIDTEIKAYYLGLFYADGSNHEERGTISITLKEEDKYIIQKLFDELNYKRPIIKIHNKKYDKDYFQGQISSKHISKTFLRHGCMNNKSFKIVFPQSLDSKLHNHFIRGYFDGDGCISIGKNILKSTISFAGNYEFLKAIQEILVSECNINKTKIHNHANIFSLSISGRFQVSRVYNYLYKNSTIYLKRKYDKFEKLIALSIINKEKEIEHESYYA